MFRGAKIRSNLVIMMLLVGGLILNPTTLAQEANDLQRENLELKNQVSELEGQLKSALATIDDLERRIEQLTRALQQARADSSDTSTEPVELEVTIDESVANASPRALFWALTSEYEEALRDQDIGSAGDRQRIAYLRDVEKWIAAANRRHRTRIEWHVKPFQPPHGAQPSALRFVAIDPVTHAELGDPFGVPLSHAHQRRLEQIEDLHGLDVIIMKATLVPRLRMNAKVQTPGTFNRPNLVGPFAEFRFTIDPSSFSAPEKDAEDAG